ncbi:MAG TPA: hypothetical protein PKK69_04100 [Ferruginibacter sp.]|nr:hypothetical protein [Ferruginibacter sp.]
MKTTRFNHIRRISTLALAMGLFAAQEATADIIVTPANNGNSISADRAANAVTTAFTAIGDIVLSEQDVRDFAYTDRYFRSLILTAPAGWEFKEGTGYLSNSMPSDFRVTEVKVRSNTITVRFCVRTTDVLDVLTIKGIEVRATNGQAQMQSAHIFRSAENPGTALISNIVATHNKNGLGGTSFATLSQKAGAVAKLVFLNKPASSTEGKPLEVQPEVMTVDQFGNFSTEGLAEYVPVKIRLSGTNNNLQGTTVLNIGTMGGNGLIRFDGLTVPQSGSIKMMAAAKNLSYAVSNEFMIFHDVADTPTAYADDMDFVCIR